MSIDSLTYVSGRGKPSDHSACIMSAARILAGEATEKDARSDNCARVCPVVRRSAIGTNDWRGWKSDEERTQYLRPLTMMLLDTVSTWEVQQKRAFIAADFACRFVVPLVLDLRGKTRLAKEVRALPEITDRETALLVRAKVKEIAADTAYAAADTAYDATAAYAATAADTAYAAYDATAYADDAAAYAYDATDTAYAYDAADDDDDDAAAARIQLRDGLIDTLKRMCAT